MSDDFTEVSTQGYFSRLGGSIVGVLFGILLLPLSVVLLYWNEGRAVDSALALDHGAKAVLEAPANKIDPALDGKLVHVSGGLILGTSAKDPVFGVTGHGLVRLRRTVQMYQWVEDKHSESHESVGGSKTTETTYSYRQEWSSQALNSSTFKHPEGHQNPALPVREASFDGSDVKLGVYRLDGAILNELSDFQPFTPEAATPVPDGYQRQGDTFYRGSGNGASPAVGDVKVGFSAISVEPLSVVAGLSGDMLSGYRDTTGYSLLLVQPGVAPAEALFKAKKQEESTWTWILRGVGTVTMLIGAMLIGRPIAMMLAFLPFLEGIAEAGIFLIALTITLPLALLTIAVAWIAHRPLIGGGLIAAAILLFILFRRMHPRRPAQPA